MQQYLDKLHTHTYRYIRTKQIMHCYCTTCPSVCTVYICRVYSQELIQMNPVNKILPNYTHLHHNVQSRPQHKSKQIQFTSIPLKRNQLLIIAQWKKKKMCKLYLFFSRGGMGAFLTNDIVIRCLAIDFE